MAESGSNQIVMTFDEQLSLMFQYISYLCIHRQFKAPKSLMKAIKKDEKLYDRVLQEMLKKMAKYGMPKDFPEDGSMFNQTSACNEGDAGGASGHSGEEDHSAAITSFWLEVVFLTIVGVLGICGNMTAIVIYRAGGNKFYTIFYRLLVSLLVVHSCYIMLTLSSLHGKRHSGNFFIRVYSYLLYPLPSLCLHASTFLTVLLAWHRFCAADKPVEYFIAWKFINPTVSALKALSLSLLAGCILVLPLYFEPEIQTSHYMEHQILNSTHVLLTNVSESFIGISEFRLNPHYIVWYRNLVQFTVTILVPFILLTYWNIGTILRLKKRQIGLRKLFKSQSSSPEETITLQASENHVQKLGASNGTSSKNVSSSIQKDPKGLKTDLNQETPVSNDDRKSPPNRPRGKRDIEDDTPLISNEDKIQPTKIGKPFRTNVRRDVLKRYNSDISHYRETNGSKIGSKSSEVGINPTFQIHNEIELKIKRQKTEFCSGQESSIEMKKSSDLDLSNEKKDSEIQEHKNQGTSEEKSFLLLHSNENGHGSVTDKKVGTNDHSDILEKLNDFTTADSNGQRSSVCQTRFNSLHKRSSMTQFYREKVSNNEFFDNSAQTTTPLPKPEIKVAAPKTTQQKAAPGRPNLADERLQSNILFLIVIVFFVCSTPRVVLNLVEFDYMIRKYFSSFHVACFTPPVWFRILTSVSSFLMTLNASIGFVIYCLACTQFRNELRLKIGTIKQLLNIS